MQFELNDGGRAAAGFKGHTGDCGVRAVAIALQLPYKAVYNELGEHVAKKRTRKRERRKTNARNGVYRHQMLDYLAAKGWTWREFECGELPTFASFALAAPERCIVLTKRHYFALIHGVRHDTHQKARTGTVIGYYAPA